MKVLSICGGLETGYLALHELGIPVEEYHTYEIFAPAIELSKKHFPNIVHHGDVIGADFSQFKGFDLVMAGTCCQSLSVVLQENKDVCSGLKGKSAIFYEFARAVEEIQPKYYLLENVIPKQKADENIITAKLGGGKSCDDKFCGLFRTREKTSILDEYSHRRFARTKYICVA